MTFAMRPKEAFGAMSVIIAYVMDVAHPHAHLLQQDLERILVRDVRRVEVLQNGMAVSAPLYHSAPLRRRPVFFASGGADPAPCYRILQSAGGLCS